MEKPSISDDAAVTQAGETIKQYLNQAREAIDEVFGSGYARHNPVLVAACVQAQAEDYKAVATTAPLYDISRSIDNLAAASDH